MRHLARQTLAVAFAFLLVGSAVFGAVSVGVVGNEDASPVGESRAWLDVTDAIVGTAWGIADVAMGWFDTDVSSEDQQLQQDIYQSAQNSQANFQTYNTTLNNHLEDTESIALTRAENACIKAPNNRSSEPATTTEAKSALPDLNRCQTFLLAPVGRCAGLRLACSNRVGWTYFPLPVSLRSTGRGKVVRPPRFERGTSRSTVDCSTSLS